MATVTSESLCHYWVFWASAKFISYLLPGIEGNPGLSLLDTGVDRARSKQDHTEPFRIVALLSRE